MVDLGFLQGKWLPTAPIAWVNAPTIGSQFSTPTKSEQTIAKPLPQKWTPTVQTTTKPATQGLQSKPQQSEAKTTAKTQEIPQNIKVEDKTFGIGSDITGIAGLNRPTIAPSIQTPEFASGFSKEISDLRSRYKAAPTQFDIANPIIEEKPKTEYTQEEFAQLPVYKQVQMTLDDKKKYIATQIRSQYWAEIPENVTDDEIVDDFYSQKADQVAPFLQSELDKVGWFIENVNGKMKINYKPDDQLTPEQKQAKEERDSEESSQAIMTFWDRFKIDTEGTQRRREKLEQQQALNPAMTQPSFATQEEKNDLRKQYVQDAAFRVQEWLTKLWNVVPEMWELATMVFNKPSAIKDFAWWMKEMVAKKWEQYINDPKSLVIDILENPVDAMFTIEGISQIPAFSKWVSKQPSNVRNMVAKTRQAAQDAKKAMPEAMDSLKSAWEDATKLADEQKAVLDQKPKWLTPEIQNNIDKSIGQSIVGKKSAGAVEKYNADAYKSSQGIVSNKDVLKLTDAEGNIVEWVLPTNLKQRSESIEQTNDLYFKQWKEISKESGLSTDISLEPVINNLKAYREQLPKISGGKAMNYLDDLITKLEKAGRMWVDDVELEMKALNAELSNFFKNPTPWASLINDVDNQFRFALKEQFNKMMAETVGGNEYELLKKQYAANKAIEKQVNQKMIVELRKVTKWLVDLPEIFISGEFGAWAIRVLMWDASWLVDLGKAWVMKVIKDYFKRLNSRDYNVEQLFKRIEAQWVDQPISTQRAVSTAKEKLKNWNRFLEKTREDKLALPSPENASKTNLWTPKNPIVAKWAVKEPVKLEGRVRKTVGWNDAPEAGDITELGKIEEVRRSGGWFPKYTLKIEWYSDFKPMEEIGDIYAKTPVAKETVLDDFAKEMEAIAPKQSTVVEEEISNKGIMRLSAEGIAKDLGYRNLNDAPTDIRNEIVKISRLKNAEKVDKAIEEVEKSLWINKSESSILPKDISDAELYKYEEGNLIPIWAEDIKNYNPADIVVENWASKLRLKWKINLDEIKLSEIKKDISIDKVKLWDILDYPELYKEFPEYKDLDINIWHIKSGGRWYHQVAYYPMINKYVHEITIDWKYLWDSRWIKNTLLHEVQHAVQYDKWMSWWWMPWDFLEPMDKVTPLKETLWQIEKMEKMGNKTFWWIQLKERQIKGAKRQVQEAIAKAEKNNLSLEDYQHLVQDTDRLRLYKKIPWEQEARLAWWDEPLFMWDIEAAMGRKSKWWLQPKQWSVDVKWSGKGLQMNEVKAPEEPLIVEARKYKSAEEFITARSAVENWYKDAHSAPSFEDTPVQKRLDEGWDFSLKEVAQGKHNQPSDYFDEKVWARYYMYDDINGKQSFTAINNIIRAEKAGIEGRTITAYRTVPKDVKVNTLENWEWITFSENYAKQHWAHRFDGKYKIIKQEVSPKDVWRDWNDINEWWYDNGKWWNRLTYQGREKQLKQIREEANSKWLKPKK